MSIYKFLYEDIRKAQNRSITINSSVRNKFYQAGYINFYEIITTPVKHLTETTSIGTAQLKQLDRQLRRISLSLDIPQEILDWVLNCYYVEYYHKLINLAEYHRTIHLDYERFYKIQREQEEQDQCLTSLQESVKNELKKRLGI